MTIHGVVAQLEEITYFNTESKLSSVESNRCLSVNIDSNTGVDIRVFLLGPISISDQFGVDFTPRNQKSRALIAMLAVAPRGSRSRVWLRDKLWSDRSEEQGSASLRQALLDIRKSLGPDLREILIADKYTATLNLSRVSIDVFEELKKARKRSTEKLIDSELIPEFFLEGIDIRDPEFEDWLAMERQVWVRRYSDATYTVDEMSTPTVDHPHISDPISRTAQGVNGTKFVGADNKSGNNRDLLDGPENHRYLLLVHSTLIGDKIACKKVATSVGDALIRSLNDVEDIRVIKISDVGRLSSQNDSASSEKDVFKHADLALRIRILQELGRYSVGIEILRTVDCSLVWSAEAHVENSSALRGDVSLTYGLICRTVDEIVRFFIRFEVNSQSVHHSKISDAVNRIFRLSPGDLDAAERMLRSAIREQPSAQAYAWLAKVHSFRFGQRFSNDAPAQIDETLFNANKALEYNNTNALVLSLVAHIHSYLFSEYDLAAALFERAIRINPAEPMVWDLYAMLHAYVGQYEKASAMANWVQHLGASSPFAYYFDTTKCIVSSLEGNHRASITAGKRALCQRPKYNSILRYLISSNAHLGNMDSARELLQKLQVVEPDFSIATLLDTSYPTLDTAGGKNFLAGLVKAGVQDD